MKYFFLSFLTFISVTTFAQSSFMETKQDDGHIRWKFAISKSENKYTIEATGALDKDWHIFSSNPGGDGSLTSTQIEVNEIQKLKTPVEFKEDGDLVEKDLEGIGPVRYFENQGSFKITFIAPANIKTFTGNISYQICNNKMCMAPSSKSFSVTVK